MKEKERGENETEKKKKKSYIPSRKKKEKKSSKAGIEPGPLNLPPAITTMPHSYRLRD